MVAAKVEVTVMAGVTRDRAGKIMGCQMFAPAALRPAFKPVMALGEFSDRESTVPFPVEKLEKLRESHVLLAVPPGSLEEWFGHLREFFVPDQRDSPWFLKGNHAFARKPEARGWALIPRTAPEPIAPVYILLVLAVVLRQKGRVADWTGGSATDCVTDARGSVRPVYVLNTSEGVRITTRVR